MAAQASLDPSFPRMNQTIGSETLVLCLYPSPNNDNILPRFIITRVVIQ
jgi:hypothetical protein